MDRLSLRQYSEQDQAIIKQIRRIAKEKSADYSISEYYNVCVGKDANNKHINKHIITLGVIEKDPNNEKMHHYGMGCIVVSQKEFEFIYGGE